VYLASQQIAEKIDWEMKFGLFDTSPQYRKGHPAMPGSPLFMPFRIPQRWPSGTTGA